MPQNTKIIQICHPAKRSYVQQFISGFVRPARSTVLRIFGLHCIKKTAIQKKVILKPFWDVTPNNLVQMYTQEIGCDLGSSFMGAGVRGQSDRHVFITSNRCRCNKQVLFWLNEAS